MLTFDNAFGAAQSAFDDVKQGVVVPDVVECGENNDVWIRVRRSSKTLELISKQTGVVVTRCKVDDPMLTDYYGLSSQQVGSVKAALNIGGIKI